MNTHSKNTFASVETLELRALLVGPDAQQEESSGFFLNAFNTIGEYCTYSVVGALSAALVPIVYPKGHIPCAPVVYGTIAAFAANTAIDYVADGSVSFVKTGTISLIGASLEGAYLLNAQKYSMGSSPTGPDGKKWQ